MLLSSSFIVGTLCATTLGGTATCSIPHIKFNGIHQIKRHKNCYTFSQLLFVKFILLVRIQCHQVTTFEYPLEIHLKLDPEGDWGEVDLSCNINSVFQFRYVLSVCNHPNWFLGKIKVPSILWNKMQHEMSILRTGPTTSFQNRTDLYKPCFENCLITIRRMNAMSKGFWDRQCNRVGMVNFNPIESFSCLRLESSHSQEWRSSIYASFGGSFPVSLTLESEFFSEKKMNVNMRNKGSEQVRGKPKEIEEYVQWLSKLTKLTSISMSNIVSQTPKEMLHIAIEREIDVRQFHDIERGIGVY